MATLAIMQLQLEQLGHRTIELGYMSRDLQSALVALHRHVSAPSPSRTNAAATKTAPYGLYAPLMGASDPLQIIDMVTAASAARHGAPNISLYAQETQFQCLSGTPSHPTLTICSSPSTGTPFGTVSRDVDEYRPRAVLSVSPV